MLHKQLVLIKLIHFFCNVGKPSIDLKFNYFSCLMMIESNFSYEAAFEIISEYLKLLNESDINRASVHAKLTELQIYFGYFKQTVYVVLQ